MNLKPIHPKDLEPGQQCLIWATRDKWNSDDPEWVNLLPTDDGLGNQLLNFHVDSEYSKNCNPVVWVVEE